MSETPRPTFVSFNFKTEGGTTCRFALTGKNFIVGPNGSGKSAIAQAVGLSVSGAADDVAGRAVTSDPGLLLGMAHQRGFDGNMVFAKTELSNGETCQWDTVRDGARIKTPVHVRPRWVVPHAAKQHSPHFPVREVREVLTASPKKARERFLSWVCADLDDATVNAAMGSSIDAYEALIAGCDDMAPVDKLTFAVAGADKQMRTLNADARANAAQKASIGQQVGARVTDEQVLAARDRVTQLESLYEDAVRASAGVGADEQREQLQEQLTALREATAGAAAEVQNLRRQVEELSVAENSEEEGSLGALSALQWAQTEGFDACPICSSTVGVAHLSACQTFYASKVTEYEDARHQEKTVRTAVAAAVYNQGTLQRQVEASETALARLPVAAGSTSEVPLETIRENLANERALQTQLIRQADLWAQMDQASARALQASVDAEDIRTVKILAQKAVTVILSEKTDAFCTKVSGHLPKGWDFGVIVAEDNRDVFYYGLYTGEGDGRYLKVGLSEAQRVTVLVALCSALDEMVPTSLSIIIAEDRGWDADTVGTALGAFLSCPQTVFVTSTVMPAAEALAGWNVIDLSAVPLPVKSKLPPPPALRALAKVPAEEAIPPAPVPGLVDVVGPTAQGATIVAFPCRDDIAIPDTLRGPPLEGLTGRARGGKFRSAKSQALKFLLKEGASAPASLRSAHEDLHLPDDIDTDLAATIVANFLVPMGIA